MEFEKVIENRFTARLYKKQPLEEETLKKILHAGLLAPTACNYQPQKVYVLKSEEALKKLDSCTPCRFGAPVCLLVCADMNKVWHNKIEEGYETSEMDCAIVTTHMMLEAENLGVGSGWIRYFSAPQVKDVFNLPENIKPVCLLLLGYKEDNCPINPLHFKSISEAEMCEVL